MLEIDEALYGGPSGQSVCGSIDPPMISLQFELQHYPGYIRLELN